MNQQNLSRLIDHLRAIEQHQFNMEIFVQRPDYEELDYVFEVEPNELDCGSVACIAGHIVMKFRDEVEGGSISDAAGIWLGMSSSDALGLFLGHWVLKPRSEITLTETIEHLETLRT
ncbi:hypothetical protein [Aquibium oceanicum]|uniref:Uncharacterized protein n=1 Tax=Aquibium oceanicum TaxID=1670800 RepID=A0A1L3SXP4_9HYPH|nr:hypothetical protein [Aquibium oceanicum]APH74150.1 hypothetical protein BSQ44_24335 [Aquibium oceanicum]